MYLALGTNLKREGDFVVTCVVDDPVRVLDTSDGVIESFHPWEAYQHVSNLDFNFQGYISHLREINYSIVCNALGFVYSVERDEVYWKGRCSTLGESTIAGFDIYGDILLLVLRESYHNRRYCIGGQVDGFTQLSGYEMGFKEFLRRAALIGKPEPVGGWAWL